MAGLLPPRHRPLVKIHHLDCGTMCPFGGHLPRSLAAPKMVCHCMLIELPRTLVLVDAGLGLRDLEDPRRLGAVRHLLGPVLDPELSAIRQVQALGFEPEQVEHVVLTHMDLDHAGGVADFPNARVHTMAAEYRSADAPSCRHRSRYRDVQWRAHRQWSKYAVPAGGAWFGFDAVRSLDGLPPEILMVPLPGHSDGHAGVAIDTPEGWLLHAGDAFFDKRTLDGATPPGIKLFQHAVAADAKTMRHNQERLIELHTSEPGVRVVCAHDVEQFDALRSV